MDPKAEMDPNDVDDFCRCPEGILQYRIKKGPLVQGKLQSDPFEGSAQFQPEDPDDKDWQEYVQREREKRDDPSFDPLTFDGGVGSVSDWMRGQ